VSDKFQVHLYLFNQIIFFSFIRVIAVSLSFDVELFNGKSTRQPNTNEFIDGICEQLQQAIETYEKTSLSKIQI
jgi:hypothetical protein